MRQSPSVFYDDTQTPEEEQLLLRAVDRANLNASDHRDASSAGAGASRIPHLSLAVQRLSPGDAFRSSKKVCSLLQQGVIAVMGPPDPTTALLARKACAAHRVPHVYMHREQHGPGPPLDGASFTLTPSPEEIGVAIRDLVTAQRWNHFTIVYDKPDALIRLRATVALLAPASGPAVTVSLRTIFRDQDPAPVLRDITKSGESNIILDIDATRLGDVLRQAQKIGMLTEYHNYIVTTLDLHTVDLSEFRYSRTNLSGFELLDRDLWQQDLGLTKEAYAKTGIYPLFIRSRPTRRPLSLNSALSQDALYLFVGALQTLARKKSLENPPGVRCDAEFVSRSRTQARSLVEAVKKIQFFGLTGPVHLDRFGRRENITLHVVQLKKAGLASIGTWSLKAGLKITRTTSMVQEEILDTLKRKTFRITTLINSPYVMLKKSASQLSGNDRFEGFCVDLVRELSLLLGFRYQLRLVRDGAYGTKDSTGRWNGMVRELVDREADLALGDLTITYVREEAVDFTMPFMTLGIGILFRKPQGDRTLFFFLSPLSSDVWLCVAVSYLGVSFLLCLLARFSPAESGLKRRSCCCEGTLSPCGHSKESELKNQFTLLNSLWFTISAIMQQGCDASPRSASGRLLAASWWFFSFVAISTYTANLASFLTRERLRSPIQSAEDLVKQSDVRYGCVRSGSTEAFFKESKLETYERMWQAMKHSMVDSNSEGVSRVLSEAYAFLMESTSIEYVAQRHCQLNQVGGLLDSKGYGIATPTGSPYRNLLSSAILRLQESGTLQLLKERWWNVDTRGRCPEDAGSGVSSLSAASELGLSKVGGVFVVLLAGLGFACIIAVVEYLCKARPLRSKRRYRRSIKPLQDDTL
ncbi:glutamate receptor ionotropic, kainate 3 [Ixodes scapularis]